MPNYKHKLLHRNLTELQRKQSLEQLKQEIANREYLNKTRVIAALKQGHSLHINAKNVDIFIALNKDDLITIDETKLIAKWKVKIL